MNAAVTRSLVSVSLAVNFGCYEDMLNRWIEELRETTDAVSYLACHARSKLAKLASDNGINCIALDWPPDDWALRWPDPVRKLFGLAYLLIQLIAVRHRTGAKAVVASEGSLMSEPLAILAARIVFSKAALYVPMVDSYEDLGYPDANGARRRFMRLYRHLPHVWITLSPGQAEVFQAWSGAKQPVLVLQNTVSKAIEQASHDFHASGLSPGTFNVLVLGRLDAKHKGLDILVEYLCHHACVLANSGLHFRFVGDGPYRAVIEQAIQDDTDMARLTQLQAWSDPMACYSQADCTLLTSRYEGVPLVMLESMALGVPVVASRLPGVVDYLHPACKFKVGDMAAALQIVERLREPVFRNEVIEFNKARYEQLASPTSFRACTVETTQQVIQA